MGSRQHSWGIRAHTWPGSSALAGALSSGSYITKQLGLIRFLLTALELRRQREEEEEHFLSP